MHSPLRLLVTLSLVLAGIVTLIITFTKMPVSVSVDNVRPRALCSINKWGYFIRSYSKFTVRLSWHCLDCTECLIYIIVKYFSEFIFLDCIIIIFATYIFVFCIHVCSALHATSHNKFILYLSTSMSFWLIIVVQSMFGIFVQEWTHRCPSFWVFQYMIITLYAFTYKSQYVWLYYLIYCFV